MSGKGFVWISCSELTLVGCYLTPSDNRPEFEEKSNDIEDTLRDMRGEFVVAGDFNSKATEWGSASKNFRGRLVLRMAASLGLMVGNVGGTPTFRRPGCRGTIPDIAFVSEEIGNRLTNWRVLDDFTGSDHQYIS